MAAENFEMMGRRLLEILDEEFADEAPGDRVNVLAVALGLRVGDVAFPADPRTALIAAGVVTGVAAAVTQARARRRGLPLDCVGSA